MKKIIMYLLVFVGIQMLAGGVVQLAYSLLKSASCTSSGQRCRANGCVVVRGRCSSGVY